MASFNTSRHFSAVFSSSKQRVSFSLDHGSEKSSENIILTACCIIIKEEKETDRWKG